MNPERKQSLGDRGKLKRRASSMSWFRMEFPFLKNFHHESHHRAMLLIETWRLVLLMRQTTFVENLGQSILIMTAKLFCIF
jgi:hypothetical protein